MRYKNNNDKKKQKNKTKQNKIGHSKINELIQWIPNLGIDLYVLGFQELKFNVTDPKAQVKVSENEDKQKKSKSAQKYLRSALMAHIGFEFEIVAHRHMWDIRIFVLARQQFLSRISGALFFFCLVIVVITQIRNPKFFVMFG